MFWIYDRILLGRFHVLWAMLGCLFRVSDFLGALAVSVYNQQLVGVYVLNTANAMVAQDSLTLRHSFSQHRCMPSVHNCIVTRHLLSIMSCSIYPCHSQDYSTKDRECVRTRFVALGENFPIRMRIRCDASRECLVRRCCNIYIANRQTASSTRIALHIRCSVLKS